MKTSHYIFLLKSSTMSLHNSRILVADDSVHIHITIKQLLKRKVAHIEGIKKPEFLFGKLSEGNFDLVLLDMNFNAGINSGNEGLFWLREIRKSFPKLPVIMITAYGNINLAVQSMKEGAADFISKPWDPEDFIAKLKYHLNNSGSGEATGDPEKVDNPQVFIHGDSEMIREFLESIRKIASTEATVLLTGENGTGKNLFAEEIHKLSDRNEESFTSIDLGSLSESLFESELFGHNKGAFTDARTDKPGKLELAHKGTLFLDEIANITLQQQQKLLQLIQERKFSRLGSNEEIQSDFRLICATNRNLKELVRSGEFRQDLYYRINTLELNVPPLRERKGDIIRLATHFADLFSKKYKRSFREFEEETISRLISYSWPGNVRELSHVIEKAVILSSSNSLSIDIIETKEMANDNNITNLSDLERLTIQRVIDKNEGNLTVSAKELGISRSTLYLKVEKYDIN